MLQFTEETKVDAKGDTYTVTCIYHDEKPIKELLKEYLLNTVNTQYPPRFQHF